ncbi:MAG TPA: DMT family transporter [Aggregatilineales bacterium]|nr:DMT family transporter [Aggregatilineales bacterium]
MDVYTGELAALATAFAWSFTSIAFTLSGRLVGPAVVNRSRLLMALIIISVFHWITRGEAIPIHAEPIRWFWLGLSGIIGYIIGDALLFQAFVMIGARLSMLIMALAPVISVILGWRFLDETLTGEQLLGIGLAIGGVIWVVTDRSPANGTVQQDKGTRFYVIGLLCALGGALGQAVGLIASRQGVEGDFSPISGNLIRLLIASSVIWAFAIANRQVTGDVRKLREQPRAAGYITFGAFVGPFIGVTLSLIAVQHTEIGIASTLMGLTPIFLLPIGYIAFKENIGIRAIVGTVMAVAGTAIIFLK